MQQTFYVSNQRTYIKCCEPILNKENAHATGTASTQSQDLHKEYSGTLLNLQADAYAADMASMH